MAYQNILAFDDEKKSFAPVKTTNDRKAVKKVAKPKDENRGCEFCGLNKIKGLRKIKNIDKLEGKLIMVWAQSPGFNENREGKELVGDAGKFLWEHGASVGLKRKDCDIQNVVRCFPVDVNEEGQWTPRHTPNKEEIRCCSIYTEQALEKVAGKTKVHLVFGQVAAKALLKGEYRKEQKTFYSERLKAWVILTYHPSYFLRGAPPSKLLEFKEAIKIAVEKSKGSEGRFSYLKSQDYKSVKAKDIEEELEKPILEMAKKGLVIVVDIEDGKNELDENVITYVGFGWKKGHSRGLWLAHKDLRIGTEPRKKKLAFLKRILENEKIPKCFQYGTYDISKLRKLLGIVVKGFVHDTMYSEYLRFPGRYAYGLEVIADIRFREFAGYKGILDPYRDKTTKLVNFYEVPVLVEEAYNGADCDLTKRIQRSNNGKVNEALLKCLMRVSPVLAGMELRGPWLDSDHADLLDQWLPIRLDKLLKDIRRLAEDDKFNPNKPQSVAEVIYDKLKLGKRLDFRMREEFPRSTRKEIMAVLADFHEFPGLVTEYRQMAKKKSTYLDGYRKSALLYGGRVRTRWHLTGTITCRLRSGGEKGNKTVKGIVNLQNIHGAEEIECLLVSDLRWRDLYKVWREKKNA